MVYMLCCADATSAPSYIVYTYTVTIIIGVQYNIYIYIYRTDSAAVAENRSRRGGGRCIINRAAIFLNLFCARRLHAHHNNIHSVFPVVIYRIKTFLLTRDTSSCSRRRFTTIRQTSRHTANPAAAQRSPTHPRTADRFKKVSCRHKRHFPPVSHHHKLHVPHYVCACVVLWSSPGDLLLDDVLTVLYAFTVTAITRLS
jgi:hypothetical protein